MSVGVSAVIYALLILRLTVLNNSHLLEVALPRYSKYVGLILVCLGFLIGLLALYTMRNSWRVGIKNDQKTALVNRGIYRTSRNPYFLSYGVLVVGYLLIFPSPIIFILYLMLVSIFHQMILDEERYLEKIHGEEYLKYRKRVRRYI